LINHNAQLEAQYDNHSIDNKSRPTVTNSLTANRDIVEGSVHKHETDYSIKCISTTQGKW